MPANTTAREPKRSRHDVQTRAPASTPDRVRVSLTSLPIEILAEILLCTCSPPTVLAVSRTCSFLYRSLAQNSAASFIWRGVRETCVPVPLPDPGDGWKKSEADYAAFVFSGGVCEVCRKTTRAIYVSFAVRIRLCGRWHCQKKFIDTFLIDITSKFPKHARQTLWVPHVEGDQCLHPSSSDTSIWPDNDRVLVRKSDWEKFERDAEVYKTAERVHAEREHAGALDSLSVAASQVVLERRRTALESFSQVMEVSTRLIHWKLNYDYSYERIKKMNKAGTSVLAQREGWDLEDLVATQAYGSLRRCKNSLLERIEPRDVTRIRSAIESELLSLQARHKRQKAEATYRERLTEVKKIYERICCGTLKGVLTEGSASSEPNALPPLSVFCALSSVCVLKGSPDLSALLPSSTSVTDDIKSPLAISLITSDVHAWLVPVQKHLMTLLGYPNGWQSASTRTLHPLKRITARFFCRRCGEGKVGRAYQKERCLDFEGVCSHVCVAGAGKSAQEDEVEVNSGDENGRVKGKGKGKTVNWNLDVFERDDKAISVIKTILDLTNYSEEGPNVANVLKLNAGIRCVTCKGWIVMDFDTAIGHAHRHERMEIELSPLFVPRSTGFMQSGNWAMFRSIPRTHLEFQRGISELLSRPTYSAKKLCKKVNYGCKHCSIAVEGGVLVAVEGRGNKGARAMDFNALRSHAKAKHGIQDIGDEDFFCYTRVENDGVATTDW